MQPSKSHEHRMRVLENQAKLAAGRGATAEQAGADPQLKIPLIVEVKEPVGTKQRARRSRGKPRGVQPDLGDL
jgi:hypothetical protein